MWRSFDFKVLAFNLKIKAEHVNGDVVFPGVVLHGPGQEGLREEEARQPEHVGLIGVVPILSPKGERMKQ